MASCGLWMPVRANRACVCCWAQGGDGDTLGDSKAVAYRLLAGRLGMHGVHPLQPKTGRFGGALVLCTLTRVCVLWHMGVHTSAGPYVEVEETWRARGAGGPRGAGVPGGTSKTLQWSSVEVGLGWVGAVTPNYVPHVPIPVPSQG